MPKRTHDNWKHVPTHERLCNFRSKTTFKFVKHNSFRARWNRFIKWIKRLDVHGFESSDDEDAFSKKYTPNRQWNRRKLRWNNWIFEIEQNRKHKPPSKWSDQGDPDSFFEIHVQLWEFIRIRFKCQLVWNLGVVWC